MLSEDLGGILEVFIFTFSLILTPIAKYSFNLKATKQLFFVRTADNTLMKNLVESRHNDFCNSDKVFSDYKFELNLG